MNGSCRLQSRGPVQDGALYIARAADPAAEALLRGGGVCVVLGPPGSGKSSLRTRLARTIAAEGAAGAHLPLGKLPSATAGAFCLGLMQGLGRALNLPSLAPFFQRYAEQHPDERPDTAPIGRLEAFLRELVLGEGSGPVTLFFDDLDALSHACAEALCAALHGLYTASEPAPGLARLSVCITSTADPNDLSVPLPPAAERVFLSAFSRAELGAFAPALAPLLRQFPDAGSESEPGPQRSQIESALLDAIYAWTGGQPYLTQHLCQQLVARAGQTPLPADIAPGDEPLRPEKLLERQIEKLVERLFPSSEVGDDPMLTDMERRLSTSPRAVALLALWRRIWRGETVHAEIGDVVSRSLWLCGFSTDPQHSDGGRLGTSSRIVSRVFDDEWARTQEARLLLRAAVTAHTTSPEAVTGREPPPALKGAALKTAQTWAVRHTELLSAAETRALLTCLEAARQEAEGRHQSSATALQRETRERSELRSQWNREREELQAALQKSERRTQALAIVVMLLLVAGCALSYVAARWRSSSSPHSQTSPAPSVITRSPAAS